MIAAMQGGMTTMDDLIDPTDGLVGDEVGRWSIEKKHEYLKRYVQITAATRKKYLGRGKAGATLIDLFCGTGRARVKNTNAWSDGSALIAWTQSVDSGSPFSEIYIADLNPHSREACALRLRSRGATVHEIEGSATVAAELIVPRLRVGSLNFVFLDPYSLAALDFRIFRTLAPLKRIDLMVHVSTMDFQRNLDANLSACEGSSDFDTLAPGWRVHVAAASRQSQRADVLEFWSAELARIGLGVTKMKLIKGDDGQRLYWLAVVAKHALPQKFWGIASNPEGQGALFE